MHKTSPLAEVTVDTPTEWLSVAALAMDLLLDYNILCAAKHTKTHLKLERAVVQMTALIDLTKSQRYS